MPARPAAAAAAAAAEGPRRPRDVARRPVPARRQQRPRPRLEREPLLRRLQRRRGTGAGGGRGGAPVFGSFPIGYKVQLSMDGKTWSAPVAQGAGSPATTVATFRPTQAKFVTVTQTGTAEDAPAWSVLNFRVYAAGSAA